MRNIINKFCTQTGQDPLLTQGAGGNVSWKEGRTLWVKASGTRLCDAAARAIFVPVDLYQLREAIKAHDFSVTPKIIANADSSGLLPSIETLLHALMPQPIVVHLHVIEVLAHLVRPDCQNELSMKLERELAHASIGWALIDYYKPGAPLAAAVKTMLDKHSDLDVLFLKNHGLVIGGDDIVQIGKILDMLTKLLKNPLIDNKADLAPSPSPIADYEPIADHDLHRLALDAELFARLQADWALYPDHVVFLGGLAHTYQSWSEFKQAHLARDVSPELIFVRNCGVFTRAHFNKAKLVQLRCYYDVLVRQAPHARLVSLSHHQIAELLDWDAEHYRINLARQN